MGKNKKRNRDPLPDQFNSPEEAGEFWDTHSGADYEDYMHEVHFEVELKRRACEVRVTDQLLREVRKIARRKGVSTETLVNLWLQEKITTTAKVDSL